MCCKIGVRRGGKEVEEAFVFVRNRNGGVQKKEESDEGMEMKITRDDAREAGEGLRGTVRKGEAKRVREMGFEVAKIRQEA